MTEADYPPVTQVQRTMLVAAHYIGEVTRSELVIITGLDQREATNEITSLIIRGALRATTDSDTFAPGQKFAQWAPPLPAPRVP